MPAGPIGSSWAVGSWADTAWEAGSWADAVVSAVVTPDVICRVQGDPCIVAIRPVVEAVRVQPGTEAVRL